MDAYFFQGKIEEPVYNRFFSNNPLLNNHSKKGHDNAKLHPPNPGSIEELVERIIHYVLTWRLSDWECVLHVYLFMTEFLEEILNLHPLLIFPGKYYIQCVILTVWSVTWYFPVLLPMTCSCLWNVLSLPVLLSNVENVASCLCRKPHRSNSNQSIVYSS